MALAILYTEHVDPFTERLWKWLKDWSESFAKGFSLASTRMSYVGLFSRAGAV